MAVRYLVGWNTRGQGSIPVEAFFVELVINLTHFYIIAKYLKHVSTTVRSISFKMSSGISKYNGKIRIILGM